MLIWQSVQSNAEYHKLRASSSSVTERLDMALNRRQCMFLFFKTFEYDEKTFRLSEVFRPAASSALSSLGWHHFADARKALQRIWCFEVT